jgi:Asp-tRNA(Asn)/Glu-tRNA(Gln) amidotransferase A subunit family amidase
LMENEGLAALVAPTTLAVAPRRDGHQAAQRHALLHAVLPLSQTGGPVVAVPSGVDAAGLPVGVQLAGRPGDEGALLSLAAGLPFARHPRPTAR